MTNAFTPGPWRAEPMSYQGEVFTYDIRRIGEQQPSFVANVPTGRDHDIFPNQPATRANAALIAAAPDMHAALVESEATVRMLRDVLSFYVVDKGCAGPAIEDTAQYQRVLRCLRQIQAALHRGQP